MENEALLEKFQTLIKKKEITANCQYTWTTS